MKRATRKGKTLVGLFRISIHALVKRATTKFIIKLYTILNFNPRPREEGDGDPLVTAFYDIISIHALVKRATNKGNGVSRSPKDFNPRPREEGDGLHIWVAKFGGDFNPRPREEGDGIQV